MKPCFVLQKRGQIVKKNPRFGIIRHFAYQFLQIIHSNGSSSSTSSQTAFSSVGLDHKSIFIPRVVARFLFSDSRDVRESRPALKRALHTIQLCRCADREHFDSAIKQIPRVTADAQFLRLSLRKETKSHALHDSRDKISPGLFLVAHKLRNCNRDLPHSVETAIRADVPAAETL